MDKTVGIIGLGIMGGAIARNLVERGWRVIGFDTDATKRAELALANIEIAGNVEQVARDVPIIMTSLPSPASAAKVAQSIADSGQSPRIVVELSTLSIVDKLRFETILNKAGHVALDCPLSGTGAPRFDGPFLNCTVPVGGPGATSGDTVAVKVTDAPGFDGVPDVTTAVEEDS